MLLKAAVAGLALALAVRPSGANTTTEVMCSLPPDMLGHLVPWDEAAPSLPPELAKVVQCLHGVHAVLRYVCERFHGQPGIQRILLSQGQPHSDVGQSWQEAVSMWKSEARHTLLEWPTAHAECHGDGPRRRLLIARPFMEDLYDQVTILARSAPTPMRMSRNSTRDDHFAKQAGKWAHVFQSFWTIAVHYVMYLQYLTLEAFDPVSDLAYMLHHKHAHRLTTAAGDEFTSISYLPPAFRLAEGNVGVFEDKGLDRTGLYSSGRLRAQVLQHDSLSAFAVRAALYDMTKPYERLKMVEVGVYQGNLSRFVWHRAAYNQGSLELHLADHWGEMNQPLRSRPHVSVQQDLGTGSDMSGKSNASTAWKVWRWFHQKGAQCIEIPHWLPQDEACSLMRHSQGSRADVFFHRTSSVGAARCMSDRSLDIVYIDADHKWWSVLQDLMAWWPKVRPGGLLMGHDFHLNNLAERGGVDEGGGPSNDVPMALAAFFRAPAEILIHTGFVWSVRKPIQSKDPPWAASGENEATERARDLCTALRNRMWPHYDFEICAV